MYSFVYLFIESFTYIHTDLSILFCLFAFVAAAYRGNTFAFFENFSWEICTKFVLLEYIFPLGKLRGIVVGYDILFYLVSYVN